MIDNKLIIIKKENAFDKGWTLFSTCRSLPFRNLDYKSIEVDEIVKRVTYAGEIKLFLQGPFLPRKVIEELKWVSKYAKIHLIAKSDKVSEFYGEIKFASITIDPSLPLNYIGIDGKDGEAQYFISDGFKRTDSSFEKLYSEKQSDQSVDLSPLEGAKTILVLGNTFSEYQDELLNYHRQNSSNMFCVKQISDFDKTVYDDFVKTDVGIIVAEHVKDGICLEKQGKLYHASPVNGRLVLVEVEDFERFISGDIFVSQKQECVLPSGNIPDRSFVLCNGEIQRVALRECHIIEKEVKISTMADFVDARFDSSEVEEHNTFALTSKNVEYRFTLVPPLFTEKHAYSVIYDKAKNLLSLWNSSCSLPIDEAINELNPFGGKASFEAMLQNVSNANKTVKNIIGKYQYKTYKSDFSSRMDLLRTDKDNIYRYCLELNAAISTEISGSQNTKIDDEIAGYERTIKEKEALIEQGVDVLQSKRRIEILKRKIEDLQKIKGRFSSNQATNMSAAQDEFATLYKKFLSGTVEHTQQDSVSSIVNNKELTQKELLTLFLQKWLNRIIKQLDTMIKLIAEMQAIDVPTDYIVYDLGGKRYIVIDEEDEYLKTKAIQEKYKLQCVARR